MEAKDIVSWWGWIILIPVMIVGMSIGFAIFMDLLCAILERKDNNDK